MQVISYGETKPVVDNKTRDNRAANRRVVIKVLE
jgi:outer membrane protein OmpA-like peptidoglycan-associated protein